MGQMCSSPIPHISINITTPTKSLDIQTNLPKLHVPGKTIVSMEKATQTIEEDLDDKEEDSECKFVRIKHL